VVVVVAMMRKKTLDNITLHNRIHTFD